MTTSSTLPTASYSTVDVRPHPYPTPPKYPESAVDAFDVSNYISTHVPRFDQFNDVDVQYSRNYATGPQRPPADYDVIHLNTTTGKWEPTFIDERFRRDVNINDLKNVSLSSKPEVGDLLAITSTSNGEVAWTNKNPQSTFKAQIADTTSKIAQANSLLSGINVPSLSHVAKQDIQMADPSATVSNIAGILQSELPGSPGIWSTHKAIKESYEIEFDLCYGDPYIGGPGIGIFIPATPTTTITGNLKGHPLNFNNHLLDCQMIETRSGRQYTKNDLYGIGPNVGKNNDILGLCPKDENLISAHAKNVYGKVGIMLTHEGMFMTSEVRYFGSSPLEYKVFKANYMFVTVPVIVGALIFPSQDLVSGVPYHYRYGRSVVRYL